MLGLSPDETIASIPISKLVTEMRSDPNTTTKLCDYTCLNFAAVILGTFGDAPDDLVRLKECGKNINACQMHFTMPFYRSTYALACFLMYRKTGKRMYRRSGRKQRNYLDNFVKAGAHIATAPYKLLVAESMAAGLSKKARMTKAVEDAYIAAVVAAEGSMPYFYIGAYSFERLATLSARNSNGLAQRYRDSAREMYQKWGATRKLALMGVQE